MNRLRRWWKRITLEEYELIITVPATTVYHEDGSRTESDRVESYRASKLIKTTPKLFIFIDIVTIHNTHPSHIPEMNYFFCSRFINSVYFTSMIFGVSHKDACFPTIIHFPSDFAFAQNNSDFPKDS